MGGEPTSPEQPFVVGRYAIYGPIALDGATSVRFARLLAMEGFARTVAIKRVDPRLAAAARELFGGPRRLTRIRHTNIVPTLDVVAEENALFLVMEYIAGETLERLLRPLGERGERVPPRIACGLVAGVLRGLHAAHDAKASKGGTLGLVHGDLAPHNVLVGADGVPRLLDFGLARATLPYVAPEQLNGPATRLSDIYQAGLILWEALTGRSPFRGATDQETMARIDASVVEPPSRLVLGVPREVDSIVLRALRRDPGSRYATARDMARDLEACIGGSATTEIGAWVEKNAGEELARRAAVIVRIERDEAPLPRFELEPPPAADSISDVDVTIALSPPPPPMPPPPEAPTGASMYVRTRPPGSAGQRSIVPVIMYALVGFALVAAVGAVVLMTRFPGFTGRVVPAHGGGVAPSTRDASTD